MHSRVSYIREKGENIFALNQEMARHLVDNR
jgi:hypothetical protein